MQIYGEYVGSIKAESFVEIHARVEGYLESLLFEEGKMVHQGDPLFIISPALYKAKAAKSKSFRGVTKIIFQLKRILSPS